MFMTRIKAGSYYWVPVFFFFLVQQ